MKYSAKKLVSALMAVAAAVSVCATVHAADYAEDPGFTYNFEPSYVAAVTGTAAPTAEVSNSVNDAVAGGKDASVSVASTASLGVSSNAVKNLAKSGSAVLEITAPKVKITIDASKITKARKLDLSMKVANLPSKSRITMKSKKDFGCEIKIALTDCKMSKAALKNAKVYCDGVEVGSVEFDANGNPIITVTKGGVYEIK